MCRFLLEKLTGLQLIKKFPASLWNPKFHHRIHKRPPPVPVLGQPNPVHIPTSHLLEIHPNIIHPSTPRSPKCSLSLRFPHQEPIHPLSSPIRATCPAHLILLWILRDASPRNTPPHGDPSVGVVYLRIVLSPEEASCMWMFPNINVLQGGVVSPSPNPKAGGPYIYIYVCVCVCVCIVRP